MKDAFHKSHLIRSSDASSFDEVCVLCGAHDISGGGWGELASPCPENNIPIGRAMQNNEWQPIETAPKDQRLRVWAWGEEHHAKWDGDHVSKRPNPFWSIDGLRRDTSRDHQPTHWMPLPLPPKS